MTTLKPIFIEATTLSDAWYQTLYRCVEHGREFVIDRGSFEGQKRLEFDYLTVHIRHPSIEPLLPKTNPVLGFPDPVAEGYLDDYLPYLMTGEVKDGESYSYGSRICKAVIGFEPYSTRRSAEYEKIMIQDNAIYNEPNIFLNEQNDVFLNQMELMIWIYKHKGHRNNQMVLQVAQPCDMLLQDPPCLRHICTRIQDGKLHFFPYFRSWDIFSGMPANLAAIELMKQYCAAEIGVQNGEIFAASSGAHIYSYCFEIAEAIRGKSIEEFKNEKS